MPPPVVTEHQSGLRQTVVLLPFLLIIINGPLNGRNLSRGGGGDDEQALWQSALLAMQSKAKRSYTTADRDREILFAPSPYFSTVVAVTAETSEPLFLSLFLCYFMITPPDARHHVARLSQSVLTHHRV